MEKVFEVKKEGTTLHVILGMELSTSNASALTTEISKYSGQGIEKVVFNASGLAYIASAGLRTIFYAHQRLGKPTEIVFFNCAQEIKSVLESVGLVKQIKFEESEEVRKQYRREMMRNVDPIVLKEKTKERKEKVENFKAHNDIVCYAMKIGQDED